MGIAQSIASKPLSEKRCSKCRTTKQSSEFYQSKNTYSGLQSWCKQCQKERNRKIKYVYYGCDYCGKNFRRMTYSPRAEAARSRRCHDCYIKQQLAANNGHAWNYTGSTHFAGRLLAAWKSSAKRRKHEWQLTKEQLDEKFNAQKGICALSGLEMQPDRSSPYRPSIDRIDSSKGYIEDNFQFVCSRINIMKNAISEPEFIRLCKLIAANR